MVVILAIKRFDMQRDAGIHGESLKEFAHELRVESADPVRMEAGAEDEKGPARNVDGDTGQGLIHGQMYIRIAGDALHIANGLTESLTKRDADIFHRVVVINMQVALRFDRQINERVAGNLVEHMVKKAHPRRDVALACAVEIDLD